MKKAAFLLFIAAHACLYLFAKAAPLLFDAPAQGNIQLLTAGKHNFCIANNIVYQIEKKGLVQKAVVANGCNDAAVYNSNIVLATGNGMQLFDTKTNEITPLLKDAVTGNISHVQTDSYNHIWFTKEFEGCFMVDDSNRVMQRVKVPVTYALAYTGNGYMWVGTNVGLYKVPVQQGDIVRYAEEGIASNDLPDNLVERLFADAQSNVWVIMPGHITYIAADSDDEFPDYEHIGKKDNVLYDIAAAKADKMYLFATAQGILLMHDIKHGEDLYVGEIHQNINEQAYLLTDAITGRPATLKNAAVTKIQNCGSDTYFITNMGLWSISTAKFAQRLKQQFKL